MAYVYHKATYRYNKCLASHYTKGCDIIKIGTNIKKISIAEFLLPHQNGLGIATNQDAAVGQLADTVAI